MNDREEERLARAALARATEPGDARVVSAVAQLGPVGLLDRLTGRSAASEKLGEAAALRLEDVQPERDLDRAARMGIRYIIPGDAEWPTQLDDLAFCSEVNSRVGTPLGLWVKGPLRLDQVSRSLAVVGSRSATTYGLDVAGDISSQVAEKKFAVISGAAFGIDQAAHRGALAVSGRTVAVLACGVDRAYPAAHAKMLKFIAEHGAVVSEVPPGCSPTKFRFLSRNRVIAGLSGGGLVVEAAIRSGALNTASWVNALSRPLMGVPGPVTSAPSAGVHQLIRSGGASLVTQGAEVLELLSASGEALFEMPRAPERARDHLPSLDAQVLDAVPVSRPVPAEKIARTAGVALSDVRRSLDDLGRKGFVSLGPRGWRLSEVARA